MKLKRILKKIIPASWKKVEEESERCKSEILAEIERLNKKVEKQEKTISELREVAEKTLEIQKCTQKKYSDLNEQIEELQEKNEMLKIGLDKEIGISKEAVWAEIFNNTINSSEWLKKKKFSPGRWALGYPALFALYRILDEFRPQNILELGLGQSSVMTIQYVKTSSQINHTIVEHDKSWIDFFKKSHEMNENSHIIQMDIEYINYKDAELVRVYKDFLLELKNNKTFDLILIDAPIGGDMKVYSRIDVLSLIPEYLGNQFVIILDDVNRMQEKRTIREIDNKLKESGIQAKHEIYSGEKETCVWASENWDFLLSM